MTGGKDTREKVDISAQRDAAARVFAHILVAAIDEAFKRGR